MLAILPGEKDVFDNLEMNWNSALVFASNAHLVCGKINYKFMSSNTVADKNKKSFEVNLCLVLAFRNIGIGYDGMASFPTTMNMHKPMTRKNYGNVIDLLHESYLAEAGASMMTAAEEVKAKTGSSDTAASFDGTWQKPDHASLNGVVTAISNKTGKVVDFDVLSKKCQSCVSKKYLDKDSNEYVAWWLEHEAEWCHGGCLSKELVLEVTHKVWSQVYYIHWSQRLFIICHDCWRKTL